MQHLRARQALEGSESCLHHHTIIQHITTRFHKGHVPFHHPFSRQDVGLAALQSANDGVAEAHLAMNQRIHCANECASTRFASAVNLVRIQSHTWFQEFSYYNMTGILIYLNTIYFKYIDINIYI